MLRKNKAGKGAQKWSDIVCGDISILDATGREGFTEGTFEQSERR